jgi:hypothetical protein
MQFKEIILFTDITITLAWIRSKGRRFKPFVSSRVGEIQSNVQPCQWRHISSEENVADDVSRGNNVGNDFAVNFLTEGYEHVQFSFSLYVKVSLD